MKIKDFLAPKITGLFILTASQTLAQTTVNFNKIRVFQNTNLATSSVVGTVSEGNLIVQPDAPLFANGNTGSLSYSTPLRVEGLDLDGVGFSDDYIDFELHFEAKRDANPLVNMTGAGIGVNGDLNELENEELTVSVVVTGVSVPGWASIDGFSEVEIYLGGNGIMPNAQADVNGTTYADTFDASAGFTFNIGAVTLANTPNIVINNVTASLGDFRFRTASFSISYDPNGVQPPPAPEVLRTNDLNLRPDALFVYPNQNGPNKGGTNRGEIVGQPGVDATAILDMPTTDFPLRWEQLDLDGEGVNNDYIDFTLRATALGNVESVTFSGEGIGVTAGGTFGLDLGEQLSFEVVDISLSPGTAPGTVTFDGFSEAGFFISGNGGVDLPTTGDAQANINGTTVMASLNGTGYSTGFARTAFPLAPTVVFDMPSYTAGTVTPVGRARDLDFQFSYQQGPAVSTELAIEDITVDPANDVVLVTFKSISGATYAVERSTTLAPNLWVELDDSVFATDTTHTFQDPGAPSSGVVKYFYRIIELDTP